MSTNQHHVVPNKEGGWDVKRNGCKRSSVHKDTKKKAEKAGRVISRNQETELIVHDKNGKISRSDSHGNDPCPPKDKNSMIIFQQIWNIFDGGK